MTEDALPEHVAVNRAHWDQQAPEWIAPAERNWTEEPSWGIWGIAESELHLLPEDMAGLDAIELGCADHGLVPVVSRDGLRCRRLRKIQAPIPGPEINFFVTADWAHRFPSEQVWKLRKR